MPQQTAVEWLIEQLKKNENIRWRGAPVSELTEQAKAMEKEQIIVAHGTQYKGGFNSDGNFFENKVTGEEYYNETYGN